MNNAETHVELTLLEACLRLGMRYHRAYALMCSGALGAPRKDGRSWLLRRADVEAYLARCTATRVAS